MSRRRDPASWHVAIENARQLAWDAKEYALGCANQRRIAAMFMAASEAFQVAADAAEEAGQESAAWSANTHARAYANRAREYAQAHLRVTKLYEVRTDHGDPAGRGTEYTREPRTLRYVLRQIEDSGPWEPSQSFSVEEFVRNNIWLSSEHDEVDYETGDRTTYSLHFDGPPRAMRRLAMILLEAHPEWR